MHVREVSLHEESDKDFMEWPRLSGKTVKMPKNMTVTGNSTEFQWENLQIWVQNHVNNLNTYLKWYYNSFQYHKTVTKQRILQIALEIKHF